MARILLGVSGGIAAWKALDTIRLATKAGHSVRVVQTPTSERFVGAASFAAITGAPVLGSEFEPDPARGAFPGDPAPEHEPISHLALVANADLYLIAPASANTLAKLAHGFADNLLTSAALAARCPVLVAPAMNDAMWEHAATQANVATLRERGVRVIDPGVGPLASKGEHGAGRLAEPAELLAACEETLAARDLPAPPQDLAGLRRRPAQPARGQRDLVGLRVLVTAGGTREPIDSVRYVGNRSSGRMGFALAEVAARRGAEVTVLAANVTLPRLPAIDYLDVETAGQLADACREQFPRCDVLLMAAAVADFRPADPVDAKIKKDAGAPDSIALERTPDILSGLAAARVPGQTVVGFAAEHGEGALDYARGKLARKGLDAIVVNDVSRPGIGFDTPDNEVTIVAPDGERPLARAPKGEIAAAILDEVVRLRTAVSADGASGPASPDRPARV
ncbi:bifunctional phosphopantothenoylcysteine decarboxylase/phosphopantothenate synthase [Conexibacter sp. JD483]|uniref:bifunctional phosphopantothenoylcysteine decarboxylase/phosphopantothenate synthase n=1 Tax=unclassified Conexibacter TaxID=2627773 RepID=UPI00271CD7C7|nr:MULTISPECIES: bifunctional phosphopantothenoylcysteine decarboxylase/phosphopantothenate synthase [unclassified Conexibacter]MDO8185176.1 bifunctional phosphopantothenoylcysteine decarboxylase/phosphopantothenate synthase [Conexibacter sp. CPCC 205706]MDO8196886.1 bifunctional phosphopantothenoylcysteine decarboxylase/phosphopantothenate synthase [Conexibacter sp. CPCC 205762]MDR9368662.1 bifunctional phosphopantothenoylcysteine decarboxylase/phosphopantothenate synthase [Conexibacter sp. JD4